MPGLVGIVGKKKHLPIDGSLFGSMVTGVCHRPWYQVDTYEARDKAIARVHLNIINGAPQPYVSENGRVKVFLHGEIYNDETNEKNQVEFIARAYECFGSDFASRLNGSFVVLVLDEIADTLMIATDRSASRPLFYYQDADCLYFAPEPKALTLVPSLPKRINTTALAGFLACGQYLNEQGLLEDIRPVSNATVLILNTAGVKTHKYWQYAFDEACTDRGAAYYQGALSELIRQAVRRRVRSQHRYGILLSGGYDSRGILGCYLDEHSGKPVNTISWGVQEDTPNSDCAVARRLALKLGLPHTFFPLRTNRLPLNVAKFVPLHDGLTDACDNYPESLDIFSDIRTELGVQVILRGDETFGFSRPACDDRTLFEKFSILPLERSRNYQKLLRKPWLSIFSDAIRETLGEISAQCKTKDIYLRQNFVYFEQRIRHYINPLNYVKSLEVEVRTPYLDNDILDFMRELPSHYHFGKRLYRALIRGMFPHIFSEMAGQSNLPNLNVLLRTAEARELLYRVNLGPVCPLDEYFDRNAVQGLHDNFLALNNHNDHSRHLIKKAGRFLARWPSIHRIGYKMYLPIQDKQEHDFISEGRILLRLLTLNLYLQRVL